MNTGSSWGISSGFGNSGGSTQLNRPSGSNTGSNTQPSFQFGTNSASAPPNFSASLDKSTRSSFGVPQSSSNATTNQGGGLFGSSLNSSSGYSSQMSGTLGMNVNSNLGGNSSATGLFGTSNVPAGGLFGNSSNGNTQGSGLDGSNPTKRSAGASSFQQNTEGKAPSTGLFGNSSSQNFGGPGASDRAGVNLFGSANNQPSRPFGTTNAPLGTFGGSKPVLGSEGLFGGSMGHDSPATSSNSVNPYGQNPVLANISKTERAMPASITSAIFEEGRLTSKKRSLEESSCTPGTSKHSIVSRLAKTFNIFRAISKSNTSSNKSNSNSIFAQEDRVNDLPGLEKDDFSVRESARSPGLYTEVRSFGDYKKLVIKSSPSKFHLIDTEKVFSAKRRRTVISSLRSGESDEDCTPENLPIESRPQNIAKLISSSTSSQDNESSIADPSCPDNGYFCSPSLEELSMLTPLKLREVNNFIIGRVGHGQISFIYPVDMSSIFERSGNDIVVVGKELFGRIVKIENAVVRVYVGDCLASPDMGTELNVPATITLKAPPKNRTIEDHIKRLQNLTGMDFVTYDPITFNWTFTVKHFSVWGLIDDSEPEDDESNDFSRLRSMKKKQDNEELEASIIYSKLYLNESYQSELKRQKLERQSSGLPGGWDFNSTTGTRGGILGVKQDSIKNEINQEINTFKERKFAHALAANASDITNDSDDELDAKVPEDPLLDEMFFGDEVRNYNYLKHLVKDIPFDSAVNNLVDEKVYEPQIENDVFFSNLNRKTSLTVSKNWLLQLELANSVDSALAPFAALHRKSQPALNSINEILFSEIGKGCVLSEQASTPKKRESAPILREIKAPDQEFTAASFQSLIEISDITVRDNGYPLVQFKKPITFAHICAIFNEDPNQALLQLASIFFDRPDISAMTKYESVDFTNVALVKRLENFETRKAFTSWLASYNDGSSHHEHVPLDEIFSEVCSGDIKSAVGLATKSNYLHLASLLTLLDSNDPTVKIIAGSQLESWKESSVLALVPEVVVKIFKLLAGDFEYFHSELPENVLIGLYSLYGNPSESLESLFSQFPVSKTRADLGEMLKIYMAWHRKTPEVTGYEIAGSELNHKLKWLILQVLSLAEERKGITSSCEAVGLSFAEYLEKTGFWRESIYVYSSMRDDENVKNNIRRVIIDNVAEIDENGAKQENFLTKSLKIPHALVYEAIALDKRERDDVWGSGEAFVVAGLWHEAHDMLCEELGPASVIEENHTLITRLRAIISSFPEGGAIIPSWNQGAGLYSRYFDLLEGEENQNAIESSEVVFLLDNAASLRSNGSFKMNASSKILARKIGDIALDHHESIANLPQKIFGLNLGANEKDYFKSRLLALGLAVDSETRTCTFLS